MNAFYELKRGGSGNNFHLSYHTRIAAALIEADEVSKGRTRGKWRFTSSEGRRCVAETAIGAFIIVKHDFKS